MRETLSPNIHVSNDGRAARYDLPPLPPIPQRMRTILWWPLLWLLANMLAAVVVIAMLVRGLQGAWNLLFLANSVLLMPLVMQAYMLRAQWLRLKPARQSIMLSRKMLTATLARGWLWEDDSRPLRDIRHLQVVDSPPDLATPGEDLAYRLIAYCWEKQPMVCGWSDKHADIEALAHDLAHRINVQLALRSTAQESELVTVGLDEAETETLHAYTRKPPASRARVHEHDTGVTIVLPPRGLWRTQWLLMLGGMVFALVGLLASWGVVLAREWIVLAFVLVPLVGGLLLLALAVRRGRTTDTLDLTEAGIVLTTRSPLRLRQHAWTWDELMSYEVAPATDRKPVMLHITGTDRKTRKLLAHRPQVELVWITAMIEAARRKYDGYDRV